MQSQTFHVADSPKTSEVLRRHGRGSLHRIGGLRVLEVAGSFAEMGEQHGALLAEEVKRGPIPYYRSMVERLFGKSMGPLSPYVAAGIQRLVGGQVRKQFPAFALETIRGIAKGAGIDEEEFTRGCTMPDALLWSAARLAELRGPGPAVAHRLELGLGCTSAIAWGDATSDGKLYHARNLDYYGVENWVDNAALIFHAPQKGFKYVSVSAAGVGLGGITAMNEAGLTITVHQHMFTDKTRLGGMPIGVVGDIVMREASTLEEAQEILGRTRPIGCWTYLVTCGKTKRVLVWEENPDRQVGVIHGGQSSSPAASTYGYANIYIDPELGATEVSLYGSYWRHNKGRHVRANGLLKRDAGSHTARSLARILGDQGSDARCRVRDSIAMVMTVGSVVFCPEDGVVWVGDGKAPTSRGEFVPFSLKTGTRSVTHASFDTTDAADAPSDEAFEHYRRAYVAYVDRSDAKAALGHASVAAELAPAQAVYHQLAGLLAVELGQADAAVRSFGTVISLGHIDEERVSAAHLWRARAHDLTGARALALTDYRHALGLRADTPVHRAAKKGLEKPYSMRKAKQIHVEMSLADVVMP